jgi:hypothetical protein
MFVIPKVNVIESDDGFSVEVLGMNSMKYIEGDNTYFIDSETLMGNPDFMISASDIRIWGKEEIVDYNTRKRIVVNIERAFNWKGETIDIRW